MTWLSAHGIFSDRGGPHRFSGYELAFFATKNADAILTTKVNPCVSNSEKPPQRCSLQLVSNDPMCSFLVGEERGFCVECTLAVFDAAEKCHLLSDAEQCAVFLALVSIKAALVQKTQAAVTILTDMTRFTGTGASFNSEIKRKTTVSFQLLKRAQIVAELIKCQSDLTWHDAMLHKSWTSSQVCHMRKWLQQHLQVLYEVKHCQVQSTLYQRNKL